MKPGYKTTEFWLSAAAALIGLLFASGVIPTDSSLDKLIGGLGGDFDLSQHFSSLRSLVTLTAQAEPDEVQEPYTID